MIDYRLRPYEQAILLPTSTFEKPFVTCLKNTCLAERALKDLHSGKDKVISSEEFWDSVEN